MNCGVAREILASGFPSPVEGKIAEAQGHVRSCESCRSYLHQEAVLRRRLREVPVEKPSARFKEKLFAEISRLRWEQSRRQRKRKLGGWFATAALVVLTIAGWLWMEREPEPLSPLVEYLIEDHQQNLPGHFMTALSSPAAIEKWFEGKVDFPLQVQVLEGAEILGARLCRVDGGRAALVFYHCRSHILSWFTFPQEKRLSLQSSPAVFVVQGYSLILWNEKGLVHAVVSDMDPQELLGMLPLS